MRLLRPLTLALLAVAPLAAVACEDPKPPPKLPPQPTFAMPTGTAAPIIGMQDTPSSIRPNEAPEQPLPGSMNAAALAMYNQGLASFANGDLTAARLFFQQATQNDPKAHQAFYSLAVVQERMRDSGASSSYQSALSLVPDYEPAIIGYAMLQGGKNLAEADRFLTEKRGQMPKSAAIAAALAEIKSLQRDTGSAQRLAQEALKINPDYRAAMVIIARDHYRNRRLDLALYALQAILDGLDPVEENPPRDRDNPEALLLRGLIWKEQGLRAQAMEQFRKAVARRPDLVEARVQLATFLLESGGAEEALPVLQGAVQFDGDNLAAHLNLGDCYRLLGSYAEAKKEFDWVLARDQSLPQVHYDLGLLYLFAPNCKPIGGGAAQSPCLSDLTPLAQVQEATKSLKKFQELRQKGESDDSDELLNRARLKESELVALQQAAAPPPPPPPVETASASASGATPAPDASGAAPAPDASGAAPAPAQ
ncbi:MAG: tetratricopeptide repeat protein [Polyangiaceae bacterium]